MSPPVQTLADLHDRYDGPIADPLRDAALAHRSASAGGCHQRLARDINYLALASVRSLARLRQSVDASPDLSQFQADIRVLRLSSVLRTYRWLGSRLAVDEGADANAARMSATVSARP